MNVKSIEDAKKIVVGILAHVFMTMVNVSQVLLISLFDEVINTRISSWANARNTISTNMTNNKLPTKIMSTVSTIFHNKKVRYEMDPHILHLDLLVIILLFITVIIYFH